MQATRPAIVMLLAAVLFSSAGCSNRLKQALLPTSPGAADLRTSGPGANLPPIVQITNPRPSSAFPASVLPSVRIDWEGTDPDGQSSSHPTRYVYRLFSQHNPDLPTITDFIAFAMADPDSLRRLYAPDFPGWTSVTGDVTSAQYTNLAPSAQYLFVVTGFDEAGDYDPVFSADKNMLRMNVVLSGTAGPLLTMFNENFNYTYPNGGWSNDLSRRVRVEFAADQPITVHWSAQAAGGANIVGYRWVLDPFDLFDETPRTDEATDLRHWSAWNATTTSATVGPFTPRPPKWQSHLFYIDVQDGNGLRSLGIVNLIIVGSVLHP